MIDQGASDLHIAANSPPRLRIDGQLIPLNVPPMSPQETMQLCYSILTESQKKTFEQRKEIDLSFSVKNLARFRANIYYESQQIAGAFRIIPIEIRNLKQIGTPSIIEKLCHLPRGLILVTGPTGSGKSTTLAAMIDEINTKRYDHIVTIEDPIEFIHNHKNCIINQRELGEDTLSFNNALKSALRQDPDVVMIGELRDLETISSALTIAETGHLVFGTLHTNSAMASINRLIDIFPPHQQGQVRTQLSMTLQAVVSQMLLPANSGGRVLGMELLINTNAVRALISEGKVQQIYSMMQAGQADTNMQTMNQSLFGLLNRGLISQELALSKSSYPDELLEMITKKKTNRGQSPIKKR